MSTVALRALSLTQPWAWLVVRPDIVRPEERALLTEQEQKPIENRTWNTKRRGVFLIHAAKGMTKADYEFAWETTAQINSRLASLIPKPEALDRGGIIGRAELYDVLLPVRLSVAKGPAVLWHFSDQCGFRLRDVQPLPFLPCRGALNFWGDFELCDGRAVLRDREGP